MGEVVWNGDERYPGPEVYGLPDFISGTPTHAELDAQPRLFSWGELKEIISESGMTSSGNLLTQPESGELEYLSRNKEMQARYEEWISHQKEIWGSTGKSLEHLREIEERQVTRRVMFQREESLTPSRKLPRQRPPSLEKQRQGSYRTYVRPTHCTRPPRSRSYSLHKPKVGTDSQTEGLGFRSGHSSRAGQSTWFPQFESSPILSSSHSRLNTSSKRRVNPFFRRVRVPR